MHRRNAKRIDPDTVTKSGIMVGLGETPDEVREVMRDLRSVDVDILTVGQYLQPSRQHLQIERYWHPEEFEEIRQAGLAMGFKWVEASPLVRSSYNAEQQADALSVRHRRIAAASS